MQTFDDRPAFLVLRAEAMGMCFGVRDALAAMAAIARPDEVTVHGELVHNQEVQRDLARRGFRQQPEQQRTVPTTKAVLVTAHGISDRERARLELAGKQIVDTTCPLVGKAHAAARELVAQGRRLVVLGKHGHVEVRGIVEDHDGAIVVESEANVRDFGSLRLGVLCQTTLAESTAEGLLAAIRAANPAADIAFADTVCSPTKARQDALADLLPRVDAVVVVGGRNSNNTQKLVATVRAAGRLALHVEGPDDVDAGQLRDCAAVGLTAGTSTLAATIDAVEARLWTIATGTKVTAIRPAV